MGCAEVGDGAWRRVGRRHLVRFFFLLDVCRMLEEPVGEAVHVRAVRADG